MAGSPDWKVYDAERVYRAACKYAEDAAVLVDFIGYGATIRFGHAVSGIVWTEGEENQPASESWDFVAATAVDRVNARRIAEREKRENKQERKL